MKEKGGESASARSTYGFLWIFAMMEGEMYVSPIRKIGPHLPFRHFPFLDISLEFD